MSVIKLGGGCNGIFIAGLMTLAAGWWYVLRKERNERLARERRRLEIEARLEQSRKKETVVTERMAGLEPVEEELVPTKPALSFSFSLLPRPPWFITNRNSHILGRLLVAFQYRPSLWKIPRIFWNALLG